MCFYIHFLLKIAFATEVSTSVPFPGIIPASSHTTMCVNLIKTGCLMRAQPPASARHKAQPGQTPAQPQDKLCLSNCAGSERVPRRGCERKDLPQPLQLTLSAGSACSTGAVHQSPLGLAALMWDIGATCC